jgi:hypothetical protein
MSYIVEGCSARRDCPKWRLGRIEGSAPIPAGGTDSDSPRLPDRRLVVLCMLYRHSMPGQLWVRTTASAGEVLSLPNLSGRLILPANDWPGLRHARSAAQRMR